MKNKVVIGIIALVIVGSGFTFGLVQHQNKVKIQQKFELQLKKDRTILKTAEAAVNNAYKSRNNNDIEIANKAITKLNKNQKKDKEKLTNRMSELSNFLKQANELKTALSNAEKSKSDTDIKSVQNILDSITDDYLKTDKDSATKQLNNLKTSIKQEKDKAKADTAAESQRQAETTAAQQASNQQAYNEAPQQSYEAPAQNNGGGNYTPPAAAQPSNPAPTPVPPSQPSNGGAGNASGISDSPGGWDTPNNEPWGEWMP